MESGPIIVFLLLGLFAGMLLLLEIGYRAGRRRLRQGGEKAEAGLGVVEGSVFALFGLLLAFTFAAGQGRYESRRVLASDEANAIGTAYLRLDLLPASAQPALRDLFRTYTDSRLEFYRKIRDLKAADAALARSNGLQAQIWSAAVAACLA